VTAFFIPGLGDNARTAEETYAEMRSQIKLDMGHPPNARRIARLWARRGGADCIAEVGVRDPLRGGTVMAIFDMGSHQPYIVWWQPDGVSEGVPEVVGTSAYAVLEFDP
jgi:hypothetical protein